MRSIEVRAKNKFWHLEALKGQIEINSSDNALHPLLPIMGLWVEHLQYCSHHAAIDSSIPQNNYAVAPFIPNTSATIAVGGLVEPSFCLHLLSLISHREEKTSENSSTVLTIAIGNVAVNRVSSPSILILFLTR